MMKLKRENYMFSLQKKIFRLLCGVILSKIRPAIYSQEKCCLLLDTQAQEKVHTSNILLILTSAAGKELPIVCIHI